MTRQKRRQEKYQIIIRKFFQICDWQRTESMANKGRILDLWLSLLPCWLFHRLSGIGGEGVSDTYWLHNWTIQGLLPFVWNFHPMLTSHPINNAITDAEQKIYKNSKFGESLSPVDITNSHLKHATILIMKTWNANFAKVRADLHSNHQP